MRNKTVKTLIRDLAAEGWKVERRKSGHWQAVPPDASKGIVHFSDSMSDRRAQDNLLADLKARGFDPSAPRGCTCGKPRGTAGRHRASCALSARTVEVEADDTVEVEAVAPSHVEATGGLEEAVSVEVEQVGKIAPTQVEDAGNVQVEANVDLDAAFEQLKTAKLYYSLADEEWQKCRQAHALAEAKLKTALEEREVAARDLAKKRRQFDALFSSQS